MNDGSNDGILEFERRHFTSVIMPNINLEKSKQPNRMLKD